LKFATLRPLLFLILILIGVYANASSLLTDNQDSSANRDYTPRTVVNPGSVGTSEHAGVTSQVISTVALPASNIYLFNSAKTRRYFTSIGENYDLILDQWHYYFHSRGIQFVDLKDEELGTELAPGILILPSVVALGSAEITLIHEFEKQGGSVLATWATGARESGGEWAGYAFLHEQFDIDVTGEVVAQDNEKFLMVFGDTPVAHTLPSGYRIWLGQIKELPLRITGAKNVAGRFMDVLRTPSLWVANAAIVYSEMAASRRVYFAFSENSWRFDQQSIYRLLDDTINWLHRRPDIYLANWPYPYRSGQILEMDTEQDFSNALNFSALLEKNGFQGTFYTLASQAVFYPRIVKRLELRHEIACHGDVHTAFKGQDKVLQSRRLDAMRQELLPMLHYPSRVTGFRPPYELTDQVVESLLFEKGYKHLLPGSEGTQAMLPYLSSAMPQDIKGGLIVLPRTQRDDVSLIRDKISRSGMTKAMIEDFDLTVEAAALGILSVHSQNFEKSNEVAQSTAEFLTYIRTSGRKSWVASGGEIASWWSGREQFKFRLTGDPDKTLLQVTLPVPGLKKRAALVILNPRMGAVLRIKAVKSGNVLPVLVRLDGYRTAIVFNALLSGSFDYYLSY
jgi:peptidoglycan/xylan/chitin deacetylase (PgdA/CDA1 family)